MAGKVLLAAIRLAVLRIFEARADDLRGPQGPKGDTGERGAQGPRGIQWRGQWLAGSDYAPYDVVWHDGSAWIALTPSRGRAPKDGSPHWDLVVSGVWGWHGGGGAAVDTSQFATATQGATPSSRRSRHVLRCWTRSSVSGSSPRMP